MSAPALREAVAAVSSADNDLPACWVLDTNIVLDLWVFADPQVQPLRQLLGVPLLDAPVNTVALDALGATPHATPAQTPQGVTTTGVHPRWLATPAMRDELARVLTYPHLVRRQPLATHTAEAVLAAYDAAVTWCTPAPRARFVCTDADDQPFIDLAVAHRAALVSKDKAVLRLKKRLATLGVPVLRVAPATAKLCVPAPPTPARPSNA